MRIDLHCHSKYSKRPALWLMQKLGCPESFTEPLELYQLARQRGMNAVTITDHNVIDGALEIAELPNTFLGCEYTTYFPQDRCKVHVLAYGFTEAQHREMSEARENIFDLVEYFERNNIYNVCAHPFFWVNDRLTVEHIEQLILLFKNWELNGDMMTDMNGAIEQLVAGLTPAIVGELSDKHDIEPHFDEPWKKNFTAGSDDHSSLHLARAYTEVSGASTLEEYWDGVHQGHAKVRAVPATPQMFARNVYGIAYQFYKSKFDLERYVNKDIFLRFMDRSLQTRPDSAQPWTAKFHLYLSHRRKPKERPLASRTLLDMARFEAEKLIREDPQLMSIVRDGAAHGGDLDEKWFEFVNQVSNKVLVQFGEHVVDRLLGAKIFDLFHSLGSAGALYALLAPYFVAFSHFRKQYTWSAEVLERIADGQLQNLACLPPKIGHFTDTFNEVNGVAKTLRQKLLTAQSLNKDYHIITSFADQQPFERGVHQFTPVGKLDLPEYPELNLLTPPFLQMLAHCYEERYTHIHVATPGPVGLAGLGIARILQLPVAGTYHTAIPQYAKALTDDSYVEDVMWKYMIWFYDQLDAVYVPSKATGDELIAKGISADKIKVYPRGVDTDRFHPSKRNGIFAERYGVTDDYVKLLYVGRVSKEKNLHILAKAYKLILAQGVRARLIVVGDGPYRAEMEETLSDTSAVFTGYLQGEELDAVYASSDALVFPSTTDTFGNVVLEAQASGIPTIVTNEGGPQENVIHGETGYIVEGNSADALAEAMATLANDPALRARMAQSARAAMEQRGFAPAFESLWDMYLQDGPSNASEDPVASLLAGQNPLKAIGV